jgi:hypothetical protein
LYFITTGQSFTIASGRTITVNSKIGICGAGSINPSFVVTIKASSVSSTCYLVYLGTLTNQLVSGATFTDVDASGSSVAILNWQGGTLTRTSNIINVTPGSFPPASNVYAGTNRGDGVTGTLHASNIATAAGSGSNLAAGDLKSGVTVDDVAGSLSTGGGVQLVGGGKVS